MSNANWKPWWEQVATFAERDQSEFLRGVYQGLTTSRPQQRQSYVMGLIAGYRNRKFEQPNPYTGKQ